MTDNSISSVSPSSNNKFSDTCTSEIPEPPVKLSKDELAVWNYITEALLEYKLIHKTDGLTITIIVKTFNQWLAAEKFISKLEKETGSIYVKTPNGYEQPHQAVYEARKLKRDLLQWLPEAALTIPSFNKAKENSQAPDQGDLFVDPVTEFRQRKRALGFRSIEGGKDKNT